MTGFNEYWKEKAQKIRKSWAAKAKRFADRHAQLEDIRKEVYLPLDFGANFSFEDYKPGHFIKLNPLISWQDMNFRFSEEGLGGESPVHQFVAIERFVIIHKSVCDCLHIARF